MASVTSYFRHILTLQKCAKNPWSSGAGGRAGSRKKITGAGAAPKPAGSETLVVPYL